MVSKACYMAAYRKKLEELATLPQVELALIAPPYWRMGRRRVLLEEGNTTGYQLIVDNPLLNGHFHLHFYPRLPRHLSRFQPDLLHIDEEPYDLVAFHALRTARKRGTRTILFTWQNLRRAFPPPFGWMEAYVLRWTDGVVAGSREAAEVLVHKGYRGPLAVIPQFGVDPDLYRPPGGDRPPGPLRLGYVGRLVREKGLLVLLEAVAGLEGQWSLDIIGEGPLRPDIEREAARLGLGERVCLAGAVPSAAMPAFYGRLDALAVPSLTVPHWKEQFGRVIIEAMACGVPVVGSDSGEIPQVIGQAGLVCPEGDAEALRAALRRLMQEPTLRAELGRRGRERVLAHYTQKRIAEETYAFYQEVLASPTR
jgi:glycosyltransferase involved in cell wall biosynthesis